MCGFAGFLSFSPSENHVLVRMGDAIKHRGPDDSGVWLDASSGIGLVHQRLSILDLSDNGHQPMNSSSGRYCIAFNGEIYNHLELREELAQQTWRGHSDTETILSGFDEWGILPTIKRAVGMFAFAVWDKKTRVLTLARDRLGEKPVYYGWHGHGKKSSFIFGSELKALRQHPDFESVVDRSSLSLYLRHSSVPSPYSIYKNTGKLCPGHVLCVSLENKKPKLIPYWSAVPIFESGVNNPRVNSKEELALELDSLLKKVIKQQMISDVPIGAFLSGGIDSSLIVALMQEHSHRPIKTFSIGFNEDGYNEAIHAKAVSKYIGTEHTELYITPDEAMDAIPRLPELYDEPFSDSSQIPTILVSELAKQHVTVALTGDGGDELFCGYNRYKFANDLWGKLSRLPIPLRKSISVLINTISADRWTRLSKSVPRISQYDNFGDKLHKLGNVLHAQTLDELYLKLVSNCCDPDDLVLNGYEYPTLLTSNRPALYNLNKIEQMMALDTITYLPDDILVKVDRAAMGVSLETRVPFLDHRVIEFAWTLPMTAKLSGHQSKWILRQVLNKYVPKNIVERPKMGFGVPLDGWLRGPLRDWAESLLNPARLRSDGYFNPAPIQQKWSEHISGERNWQYHLWDVLMFQAWLDVHHKN
jgi:asparagine synthase (glutamine-hydrolysing)